MGNILFMTYFQRAVEEPALNPETLYFFQVAILIHITVALNILLQFYGVTLRQELIEVFLERVFQAHYPAYHADNGKLQRKLLLKAFLR